MAKTSLPPGFRFHPTDVELVWYYLKRKIMGKPFQFEAISELELYKFAPWDLPGKSCLRSRDLEWYFFCPRDKKYTNGSRMNRATDIGFWKTTGKDRTIAYNSKTVGMKKTLIFHIGKAPRGTRTDWVMYEFRLEAVKLVDAKFPEDAFVLCKIFQKSGAGPKNGEQYGAPFVEEDWDDITVDLPCFPCQETSVEHHSLSDAIPLQSACFEVGEPSTVPYVSESGAPSSMPASVGLEAGEPLSAIAQSEVGNPSIPQISHADEVLLERLEQFLNTSQPHQENANCEMLAAQDMCDDVDGMLPEDIQGLFGELDDILPDITGYGEALQQGMGLDDIPLPNIMGCDSSLHQSSELAAGNYVEINDLNFSSANQPLEWINGSETQYTFADTYATLGLNNIVSDGMGATSRPNVQHDTANDDWLPTSDEDLLWLSMFPWQKDRPS